MNLLSQKVTHRVFGIGTIVAQDDAYITAEFAAKTSRFLYPGPDTFTKFLQAEDKAIQEAILQEIAEAKALEEEAQRRLTQAVQAAAQACAEARQVTEKASKKQTKRPSSPRKAIIKRERLPGQRMTFYVFQGSTFDQESCEGYIWAPSANKEGNTFHYWERLLEVYPGDIILHGCHGFVRAVSVARCEAYGCDRPNELSAEAMWDLDGRRVDCTYTILKNPLKTGNFKEDIVRLCSAKYAPFDKDGNGNMGYLFEINRELARIFLRAAIEANVYLKDIDYIQELLSENDGE